MKTQFDIHGLIKSGRIKNELDLERALTADRKLRLLAREDASWKLVRKQLRDLIQEYESKNWSGKTLSGKRLKESDAAEAIAEKERIFVEKRKELIKAKLKKLGITQQELGVILGHTSKSYMSELMNGISPFSLRDLVVIHRLLKISLPALIPTFLPHSERMKIKTSLKRLNHPRLKLSKEDFALD